MKRTIWLISAFNGISATSQALKNKNIKVEKTFISEICDYANKISLDNFPDSIQLGNITTITNHTLLKIKADAKEANADILLVGGFPCQNLSYLGDGVGLLDIVSLKQYQELKIADSGEFKGSSFLFWELVRLKEILQPKYFLAENVAMAKKWIPTIEKGLGLETLYIDSKIVSPQSRKRNYWSNLLPNFPKEKNDKVVLDILDDYAIFKPTSKFLNNSWGKVKRIDMIPDIDKKCHTLVASMYKSNLSRFVKDGNESIHALTVSECERLQGFPVGFCSSVSVSRALYALGNSFNIPTIELFLGELT